MDRMNDERTMRKLSLCKRFLERLERLVIEMLTDDNNERTDSKFNNSKALSNVVHGNIHAFNQSSRRMAMVESYLDSDEDKDNETNAPNENYLKSEEEKRFLRNALRNVIFCAKLQMEQMELVIDAMFPVHVKKDEVVMVQGEMGNMFYVIESGKFEVLKDESVIHVFDQNGYFGEVALVFGAPRSATVRAISDGRLWCIRRQKFRRLVVNSAKKRDEMYDSTLASIPLFDGLDLDMKINIIEAMDQIVFNDNDCIIREGDVGDCMYFIESGEVRFESKRGAKKLKNCMAGDYFGELALINSKPRAVSAFAVGKVVVGVLSAVKFKKLMTPLLDVLEKNKEKYKDDKK